MPSTPFVLRFDNFNRANGNLTSGNWSQVSPLPPLAIASNLVKATYSGFWNAAYWSDEDFGDRQFSQFEAKDGIDSIVPFVRGQLTSPGDCYGFGYAGIVSTDRYSFENDLVIPARVEYYDDQYSGAWMPNLYQISGGVYQVGGTPSNPQYWLARFTLEKYVSGVQTILAEYLVDYSILRSGLIIGLKSDGSVLTPYLDGTFLTSYTDASLTGGKVGIAIYGQSVLSGYTIDNWVGGGDYTGVSDIASGVMYSPTLSMDSTAHQEADPNIMTFPTFSMTGTTGENARGTFSIPAITLSARGGASFNKSIPAITLSSSATLSPLGKLNRAIPRISLSAHAIQDGSITLNQSIPAIRISASGALDLLTTLNSPIPAIKLTASAISGYVASLNKSIWPVELDAHSYWLSGGTLNIPIPAIQLTARARGEITALSLNIKNFGLTKYTGFDFNSMCVFNGKTIGAKRGGIYELSGNDDDGTPIEWKWKVGYFDMESGRLGYLWVTGKMGDIILAVETPDGDRYEYLSTSISEYDDEQRIKVGKGIKSRYVSLEFSRADGQEGPVVFGGVKVFAMKKDRER